MKKYVALLRGINVSGQKKIKMAELREQLKSCGFENIESYIQSGNILFYSVESDKTNLQKLISGQIKSDYGFEVETLVVDPAQLKEWTENNPFIKRGDCDLSKVYYTMLKEDPSADRLKILNDVSYPPEEFIISGRMVYLYSPERAGRAKLSNNFIESKLKVPATTRNHKTMLKLYEMAVS